MQIHGEVGPVQLGSPQVRIEGSERCRWDQTVSHSEMVDERSESGRSGENPLVAGKGVDQRSKSRQPGQKVAEPERPEHDEDGLQRGICR